MEGTRAPFRPSAEFALIAVAGGVVQGVGIGIIYTLSIFVPIQLFDPSAEGGTGSPGLTVVTMVVGAGIGAFSGGLMGAAAVPGLLIAWALRVRPIWAVLLGAAGVTIALSVYVLVIPFDARLLTFAVVALLYAIVGLAVIDGIGRSCSDEGRS
ncbi:hypothetical protein [Herbiconiux liangxiaofengii]|uniref:hypothetical protein n=1 Tax=Herbiconiux liangxiaofengii TaxID=3342795 RepID=UPI0035BB5E15